MKNLIRTAVVAVTLVLTSAFTMETVQTNEREVVHQYNQTDCEAADKCYTPGCRNFQAEVPSGHTHEYKCGSTSCQMFQNYHPTGKCVLK